MEEFENYHDFNNFLCSRGLHLIRSEDRRLWWKTSQALEKAFAKFNAEACVKCGGSCCKNCNIHSNGYFCNQADFLAKAQIAWFKELFGWTPKRGFVDTKAKKCRIPRPFRSEVCLSFICGNTDPLILEELKTKVVPLVATLNKLKLRCNIIT